MKKNILFGLCIIIINALITIGLMGNTGTWKTWTGYEVLTSTDLNAQFTQVRTEISDSTRQANYIDSTEVKALALSGTDLQDPLMGLELWYWIQAVASDSGAVGFYTIGTAGETVTKGTLLRMASTGKYVKTDADSSITMPCIGIAMNNASADSSLKVLLEGKFRLDSWNWTIGAYIYPATTTGTATATAVSGQGDQLQIIGYAVTADIIRFRPDLTIYEF